ncbi:MAG: hypothetical protein JNK72_00095 [Myxococcales bacterium]|nr:hypothetical protein [Myxococcales bacterium]
MATDNTEPPVLRIVGIGIASMGILVGLQFAFTSYFQQMYDADTQRVQVDVLRRDSYRAAITPTELEQRLSTVRGAMDAFGRGDRPDAVTPRSSTDTAALAGWGLMPRTVPTPPPVAPVAPAAPVAADPLVNTASPAAVGAAPAAPAPTVAPAAPSAPAAPPTPVVPPVPAAPPHPAPAAH